MPTVVNRFVNTGSSAGGDGTTNATSGANRAWVSWQEALTQLNTAYSSNLVTADVQIELEFSGATDDTVQVTAAWPTSDATRYINIKVPTADQKMAWDTNVYTLVAPSGRNFTSVLFVNTNTLKMSGVQIQHLGNLNVGSNNGIFVTAAPGLLQMDGVKIRRGPGQIGAAGVGCGSVSANVVVRNCVTIGFLLGLQFVSMGSNSELDLYNNTLIGDNEASSRGITVGFTAGGSNKVARVKNNLQQIHANNLSVTNATTDDQATNHHNTGTDAAFVDSTNADFSLTAADTVARNQGTDLSGVANFPFSVDANGTTRPVGSAWDIGAHEQTTPNTGRTYAMIFD